MSEENKDIAQEVEADVKQDIQVELEKTAEEMASEMAEREQQELLKEKEGVVSNDGITDANFPNLQNKDILDGEQYKRELDFILDIPLNVSVELGRTKLLINELLQLGQGSVIELNKLAGELLEIYVNGKLIARGEAVVVNEKFGVRLTDIISPLERVKQLN